MLNLITDNRTELMGLAILWVYIFHSEIYFPDLFFFLPLTYLKVLGYGGVDAFLFLSGFGLMKGMLVNNYSVTTFYFRRFLRVMPNYWIGVLLSFGAMVYVGKTFSIQEIIWKLTTFWFWSGQGRFLWYVPAIMFLYLIFPPFYKFYLYCSCKLTLILAIVILCSLLCYLLISSEFSHLLILASRIPTFFIGAHVYYVLSTKQQLPDKRIVACMLLLIMLVGFSLYLVHFDLPFHFRQSYGLIWYPFTLIICPSVFFAAYFVKKLPKIFGMRCGTILKSLLTFCGVYCFEIYLLHENVVFVVCEKIWTTYIDSIRFMGLLNKGRLLEYAVYFAITIGASILLRLSTVRIVSVALTDSRISTG